MYDKVDIYVLPNEAPELIERVQSACRNSEIFTQIGDSRGEKYLLSNGLTHAAEHSLTVEITRKRRGSNVMPPMLHISGSLRKWFYGALSMDDLTKDDTESALCNLADALDWTYEELRARRLSAVEVGLNVDLAVLKCADVQHRICSFKSAAYRCFDTAGYKQYRVQQFHAKVYNKPHEIIKELRTGKGKHGENRFLLKYGNKNILRVEFKAWGGASKLHKQFGIRTVDDLVENYREVMICWIDNFKAFEFKPVDMPPFCPVKRSCKEFNDYIYYRGILTLGEVELETMRSRLDVQARKDSNVRLKASRQKFPEVNDVKELFREQCTKALLALLNKQDWWLASSECA